MADNVKVAVRMRPFNKREKEMNAKKCVEMVNNQTILTNPEDGVCAREWAGGGWRVGSGGGGGLRVQQGLTRPAQARRTSLRLTSATTRLTRPTRPGTHRRRWCGTISATACSRMRTRVRMCVTAALLERTRARAARGGLGCGGGAARGARAHATGRACRDSASAARQATTAASSRTGRRGRASRTR